MPVPLFASPLDRYKPLLIERIADVVRDGRYILGPEVQAFEREFASYLGVRHCIGVANGTDALAIALRALGVQPGDEVVMPSYTFYATAEAAADIGAVPVFCDVDPHTFCVTAETVEAALTPRTKAVIAVHLFGNVAPVPQIRALGLPVLEDAAQAAGAKLDGTMAGALGAAATFSFFPSKNLPCLGDGGAVVTDDDEVAKLARRLRFHGSDDKQTFIEVGYNSRLDELQAAALRVLLPELDGWNAARRAVAVAYETQGLGDHVALAGARRRRRARVPPVRGPSRACRRAGGRAERRGRRRPRLLPRARAPPTGHGPLRGRDAAPPRHRGGGPHRAGAADGHEPGG